MTSKSDDSDSSTDSDEENILELLRGDGTSEDDSFMEDPDRAEALRQETTGRILDCIFLPRHIMVQLAEWLFSSSRNSCSRIVAAVAEWSRYRIVASLVTSLSPVPLRTHRVGQFKRAPVGVV
ncbi:hypothetical protein TNCV_5132481 [Trichonephila clavipes]|nr:hypothetical protein TNCV_5132481 [Trichonephila clavipes]